MEMTETPQALVVLMRLFWAFRFSPGMSAVTALISPGCG